MNPKTKILHMNRLKFYLLTGFSVVTFLIAIYVGWLRLVFTPWLAQDSTFTMEKTLGPNHDPHYHPSYDDLYHYAAGITQHRDSLALFYQTVICLLFVLLGIILLLWSRDVKKSKI